MATTTAVRPATDKQIGFIRSLAENRQALVDGAYTPDASIATAIEWSWPSLDAYLERVRELGSKKASATIDRMLAAPKMPAAAKPAGKPMPDVPAGHYAVESLTGNNDLDFFRVDKPDSGKWAGYTFVKRVIGGRPDVRVRGDEAVALLEAALIEGTDHAAKRYGQEIGQCSRCNRHLTHVISRYTGFGPHCRSIVGIEVTDDDKLAAYELGLELGWDVDFDGEEKD